nr:reverse transcriptase domain-containing protein [Tanacetum cinerariifolium]
GFYTVGTGTVRRLPPVVRKFSGKVFDRCGSYSTAPVTGDDDLVEFTSKYTDREIDLMHRQEIPYDSTTVPIAHRDPNDKTMPPKGMSAAAIQKLVADKVAEAIAADRATRVNAGGSGGSGGSGNTGGPARAPVSYAANRIPWTEMKKLMTDEFCLIEEIQRIEHEMVEPERVKVDAYIQFLSENIKGEVTSSKPANLTEAVRMTHKLTEQKLQAKAEKIAKGNKRKWKNSQDKCGKFRHRSRECNARTIAMGANTQPVVTCYDCRERGHVRTYCPKRNNQRDGNATGQAYVMKVEDKNQGPNVVTGTFLLNNRYATILFDSRSDKSFVNTRFSHIIDIEPIKLDTSYEVELADGKVVSTNTVLKGCTINLANHLFEINLMTIELGSFHVVIGMDWLVERDDVIECGKKVVHTPYKNKTLVVEGDRGVSRLKVISCIKARKYIESGCQLYLAQVTGKEPIGKRLEDVPVIVIFVRCFLMTYRDFHHLDKWNSELNL